MGGTIWTVQSDCPLEFPEHSFITSLLSQVLVGGTIWTSLPNLPNLTAVFECLYKFFNKVANLGPACWEGGVQAIRPCILLVRLVELSLAIGILITILLRSCKLGARVGGTGRVDFIRIPTLKAILPYLCISTTPSFVL